MPINYEQNRSLIRAGGAVVYLRPRQKRPYNNDWQVLDAETWAGIEQHFSGAGSRDNLGIRLGEPSPIREADGTFVGFLRGIDLDIRLHDERTVAEAHAALMRLIGDTSGFAISRSGSGGPSRHFFFLCDLADGTFKIHSGVKCKTSDGTSHWTWEIEIGGTGKQFVLPGSIHPNGKLYEWDQTVKDWTKIRFIESADMAAWRAAGQKATTPEDEDEAMAALVKAARRNYHTWSDNEIQSILDDLFDYAYDDYVADREGWLAVGFALKDYLEDDPERAFELWDTYSCSATNYNYKDQRRVWKSIKGNTKTPLTLATLKHRSRAARNASERGLLVKREVYRDELPANASEMQRIFDDLEEVIERDVIREANQWTYELNENEDTRLAKPHDPYNIALHVANDPRFKGCIAKNQFTGQIVRVKDFESLPFAVQTKAIVDKVNGDPWTDADDVRLKTFFAAPPRSKKAPGFGWKVTKEAGRDAVIAAAELNAFHPVRERLRECGGAWDGRERMETVLIRYLGVEDTPYHRQICRNFFLAGVMRAFEPGAKYDFAIILEGPEGVRKSSFVKALAMNDKWFGELEGDFRDIKGMTEKMMGIWINELPELSGMARSGVEAMKHFMSSQEANVRFAYDVYKTVVPRQGVFMGTTNNMTYLQSETGNRRFYPVRVRVSSIDTTALRREIAQVWGEAYTEYRSLRSDTPKGDLPLYLTDEAAAAIAFKVQADRKIESAADIGYTMIEEFIYTPKTIATILGTEDSKFEKDETATFLPTRICVMTAWTQAMGRRIEDLDDRNIALVSTALGKLNWSHKKRRLGGKTVQWHWIPRAHERDVMLGYRKARD